MAVSESVVDIARAVGSVHRTETVDGSWAGVGVRRPTRNSRHAVAS